LFGFGNLFFAKLVRGFIFASHVCFQYQEDNKPARKVKF